MIDDLIKYYKSYYGIPEDDASQDVRIKLFIQVALEKAKRKACDWHKWDDIEELPAPILLGILTFANLSFSKGDTHGIKSESIGGMTQVFKDYGEDDDYFKPAYDLFEEYCESALDVNQMYAVKAKRKGCCR